MKLTNYMRDAFVSAVMDDVPSINYDELARNLIQSTINAWMPPAIAKVVKDYPDWFETRYITTPGYLSGVHAIAPAYNFKFSTQFPEVYAQLEEMSVKKNEQTKARRKLEVKVHSAIYSCTTRKQAVERLPEFEKYLPADEKTVINRAMPAIANLVEDLTHAGWPKDKPLADAHVLA